MTVFELVAKIALDDTDYSAAVDRAKTKAESAKESLSKIGTAAKDAGKTFAKIGTGIAAAGTAVFAFANKVTQTGDNIDKMSQKLGISAEAYQEWDFILTHCGASVEGLQTSMKTLANAAADGTDSTKAAFEKLGLSMDEVSAMSQEDLFSAVITQLQNMGESTERTAIAADLLGRSATELGPVFNMSAEETEALRQQVHDLGAVMSDEAVKNSAAFQDAMTDVKTAFSGAANTLAEELIPHITDLMNNIAAFVADGGLQKIIDSFSTLAPVVAAATSAFVAYKVATSISSVIDALKKATESQTIAQVALNAVMNANPFVLVATLIAGLVAALVTLWNTNEGFRNAVKNIWSAITGFFTGAVDSIKNAWNGIKSWFQEKWDGIKSVFSDVWKSFKDIGRNIVQGIWDGINAMYTWIKNKVTGFFNNIVGGVKSLLGIHSPSKVFAGIGGFMAEGLGEGWDDAYSKIERDINKDLDFSGNITTSGNYSGYGKTYGSAGAALSGATINITVNGANIQNDQQLAERIAQELWFVEDRRAAAFG